MILARCLTISLILMIAGCRPPAEDDAIVSRAKSRQAHWIRVAAAADAEAKAQVIEAFDRIANCPAKDFKFVADDQLSVVEASRLNGEQASAPIPARDGRSTLRLSYRSFDFEAYPTRDGWSGIGAIYVRAETPDRRTIGGVLWAKGGSLTIDGGGEFKGEPNGESLTISLSPQYADAEGTEIKCVDRFEVTLGRDGVMSAGGRRVGVFR